jgi:hypothetical protein
MLFILNFVGICAASDIYVKNTLFTLNKGTGKSKLGYDLGFKAPYYPQKIIVDDDGSIWIFDKVNNAIKCFSQDGNPSFVFKINSFEKKGFPIPSFSMSDIDFCLFQNYVVVLNGEKGKVWFINKIEEGFKTKFLQILHRKKLTFYSLDIDLPINLKYLTSIYSDNKNLYIYHGFYTLIIEHPLEKPKYRKIAYAYDFVSKNGEIYGENGWESFRVADNYNNTLNVIDVKNRGGNTKIEGIDACGNIYYVADVTSKHYVSDDAYTETTKQYLFKCNTKGEILAKIDIGMEQIVYKGFFVTSSGDIYVLEPEWGKTDIEYFKIVRFRHIYK